MCLKSLWELIEITGHDFVPEQALYHTSGAKEEVERGVSPRHWQLFCRNVENTLVLEETEFIETRFLQI